MRPSASSYDDAIARKGHWRLSSASEPLGFSGRITDACTSTGSGEIVDETALANPLHDLEAVLVYFLNTAEGRIKWHSVIL
jgi:hypothetical protein